MLLQGNLQDLQHLGIPVTDIERSKAFYEQFGFTETLHKEIPYKPEPIAIFMLQKGNFTIELFQLSGEEWKAIGSRSDGHIDHLALNVIDIDKAYAEMKTAGFEILEQNAPVFLPFWEHGLKYFTVRGPDGEKVEFNQVLSHS